MLPIFLLVLCLFAQPPSPQPAPAAPVVVQPTRMSREWTIDGARREAIVFIPSTPSAAPTPVVFAFHGHGGSARQASRSFEYQKEWPEAISVYMQGLPTPGALTDPKGERNGWQKSSGDQNDRDLKFFDAVLASLRKDYKIDDARIYCTGHSNGGGFTYLLWAERGEVFAAVAPSSAAPGSLKDAASLKPKPCMHIAGEKDPLVKFALQERAMERVRKVNNCETTGKQWGSSKIAGATAMIYDSRTDTPFVSLIHPGGHEFLDAAPAQIVKFFKEHAKSDKPPTAPKSGDEPKPGTR